MKFARFYKIEKVIVSAETICENTVTVFIEPGVITKGTRQKISKLRLRMGNVV